MARIPWALGFLGLAFAVTACTGSTATIGPTGGPGGPSASPSSAVGLGGPPSAAPSTATSPAAGSPAPAPSGSSPLACEIISQQDASSAIGVSFPVGKAVAPKPIVPLTYRSQCLYSNGASPATNLTVDISTYDPSYPVATARDKVVAGFLARVGTNNGLTFSASNVMIDGNPGVTTLLSGAGAGGVEVHIETAEYWNGLTTVAVTVGNGPLGAAVAVAKVAAGKL